MKCEYKVLINVLLLNKYNFIYIYIYLYIYIYIYIYIDLYNYYTVFIAITLVGIF